METKESVLELINFNIIDTECHYITSPPSENIKDQTNQNKLPIDINFDVKINREECVFLIFLATTINPKKQPGYFAQVESVGIFKINQQVDEREEFNLIHFSGLQICIAHTRAYLGNITAYYPDGRFLFHSIDLRDLVEKKIMIEKEKEAKKAAEASKNDNVSNNLASSDQAEKS